MTDPVVQISGLSKVYQIGHEDQVDRGSLREAITRTLKKPPELFTGHRVAQEKFWALKDITVEINRGDVVGLIGRNGSGKSTLLKILSQIVEPSEGEVVLNGNSASLLEVGTGFHPELTGRENIYFNGSILGMSRKEIEAKFAEIVEFSEIERFLDTPVKFYSSGMYVRLAFAVAAHLEPDILIVDEVLAVGDAAFQRKSLGKMRDATQNAQRTVIFVSHSMEAIQSICNKCIWLDSGKVIAMGETSKIVEQYISSSGALERPALKDRTDRRGNGDVRLTSLKIQDSIQEDKQVALNLQLNNLTPSVFKDAKLSIDIYDGTGVHVSNLLNYTVKQQVDIKPGPNKLQIVVSNFCLAPGRYSLNVFIASDQLNKKLFDWVEDAAQLLVQPYDFYGTGSVPSFSGKFVYLNYDYKTEKTSR